MIQPRDLISPDYLATQLALHADPRGYGGKGDKWAPAVWQLVSDLSATSVLDYGCGEGALVRALWQDKPAWLSLREYDPAMPGKDDLPLFADLVVCTDVLEHVEAEKLDAVLQHLKLLARKATFVVIATRPSHKTLLDGRNAHLILESADWWQGRLAQAGFTVAPGPISPHRKPSRELSAVLT